MGHLRGKVNEFEYRERERRLKEEFINDISDNDRMTKIVKRTNCNKKINEKTSEQVLSWTKRVEAQRAQKAILDATKEKKGFDIRKKQTKIENPTQCKEIQKQTPVEFQILQHHA